MPRRGWRSRGTSTVHATRQARHSLARARQGTTLGSGLRADIVTAGTGTDDRLAWASHVSTPSVRSQTPAHGIRGKPRLQPDQRLEYRCLHRSRSVRSKAHSDQAVECVGTRHTRRALLLSAYPYVGRINRSHASGTRAGSAHSSVAPLGVWRLVKTLASSFAADLFPVEQGYRDAVECFIARLSDNDITHFALRIGLNPGGDLLPELLPVHDHRRREDLDAVELLGRTK